MKKIKKICCIGAGYVGGPTMAVLADKCPYLEINVVDINKNRICAWNDIDLSKLPIYEPGLEEIIRKRKNKNLFFSTEVEKHIKNAEMIFISVNTPTKTKGLGAGKASDLKWVEASARQVAKYAKNHTIVVEKSTLPVRTAEVIKTILENSYINTKDEDLFKQKIFSNFNRLFTNNASVNQLTCNEEISIMKWRASQPSGLAVPLSLQFSRKSKIGFCGDWFEGNGFGRIEGSILSALILEKKIKDLIK